MATDELVDELERSLGSRREAKWIAEELHGIGDAERCARARAMAVRRSGGEPLQYVLGHWPFRTLDLAVDRRALVPRPETEELVGLALDRLDRLDRSAARAIACDLGCGSGAIALSLAVEGPEGLQVHATEVDPAALELAVENAERTGVDHISFHLGSWFAALPSSLHGAVHLVCANPPYVSAAERPSLAPELDFEPELALVSDEGTDGTAGFGSVERVIGGALGWLAPGGWLVVEHGDRHRDAAMACATHAGFTTVEDRDDLAGSPRVLLARKAG